jgi:hypothetical protein
MFTILEKKIRYFLYTILTEDDMSEKVINEAVEVLARTSSRGDIIPELVTWKGKNYTVASIEGGENAQLEEGVMTLSKFA